MVGSHAVCVTVNWKKRLIFEQVALFIELLGVINLMFGLASCRREVSGVRFCHGVVPQPLRAHVGIDDDDCLRKLKIYFEFGMDKTNYEKLVKIYKKYYQDMGKTELLCELACDFPLTLDFSGVQHSGKFKGNSSNMDHRLEFIKRGPNRRLKYVPEKLRTSQLCLEAIKHSKHNISDLPKHMFLDPIICQYILDNYGGDLECVPLESRSLFACCNVFDVVVRQFVNE